MPTIFIGTAGSGSKGIYSAEFNAATGTLSAPQLLAEAPSPSFLARSTAFHPDLYAVGGGDAGNAVALAYSISGGGHAKLTAINDADAGGAGGCHISVHPNGHSVFVANYTAGSVASFAVDSRGAVTRASYIAFPADGHGPDPDRQTKSFAHCAMPSPDGGFVLVNDLGLDCIHIFRLDRSTAQLTPHNPPQWKAKPGSGPRHVAMHPRGKWIYNVNELSSTVDLLYWDAAQGTLTTHTSVSSLPPNTANKHARACEAVFSPDARFLYVSNRVEESFAVFAIDSTTGELSPIQFMPNRNKESRHMAIDSSGKWLLSANQFENNISVMPRDSYTGKLGPQVSTAALGAPSCLVFG